LISLSKKVLIIGSGGCMEHQEGGHKELVDFFIEKGANDWDDGMYGAAEGGHKELVDFFIQKGADWWNGGMYGAAKGGHKELVDFFKLINKLYFKIII
jgi:hypothetical protein